MSSSSGNSSKRWSNVVQLRPRPVLAEPDIKFSSRLDQVLSVQKDFGLTMPDLAAILRVPQDSFIKWVSSGDLSRRTDGDSPSDSDKRIKILAHHARWWHANTQRSVLRYSRQIIPGIGRSIFDLMCDQVLNEQTIIRGLSVLASKAIGDSAAATDVSTNPHGGLGLKSSPG